MINLSSDQYSTRIEVDGAGRQIYIGECLPAHQLLTGQPVWRIKKIIYDNGNIVAILWADGIKTFSNVWTARATYTY